MAQDLTTLEAVKAWLADGGTAANSEQDPLIRRMIGQASRFVCNETGRPFFLPTPVTEIVDGRGDRSIAFRRFPVLSVSSLTIDGIEIEEAPPLSTDANVTGYVADPWDGTVPGNAQFLTLRGQRFTRGTRNVAISYVAGYQISAEAAVISDDAKAVAQAPLGSWASDRGVTFADGTALTPVKADVTPAAGQYRVAAGTYVFSSDNAGQSVLLTYGFVPSDIEQACIEMVAERIAYAGRIGVAAKTLASQETISFSLKAMPSYIAELLQFYRDPSLAG